MMIKSKGEAVIGDWDWLGYAVEKMGGPSKAASKIGISRQTLYTWLEEGLGSAPFRKIVAISEVADVPLDYLKRRLGPFEEVGGEA